MNGLDKLLKGKEAVNKWNFNYDATTMGYRLICEMFCFIWINLFVAILPPIALFSFLRGSYWEAGGELVFALLALYANKILYK